MPQNFFLKLSVLWLWPPVTSLPRNAVSCFPLLVLEPLWFSIRTALRVTCLLGFRTCGSLKPPTTCVFYTTADTDS